MKRIIDALLENGKEFEYETKANPDVTRDTIYIPISKEKEIVIEKHKACYMVKVPPKSILIYQRFIYVKQKNE